MRLVKSPIYFFSCRLAHRLSSDVRQVIVLIVRLMISPHDKNNLQPLRCQSPKRLGMTMSFRPLVAIVFVRPLTAIERVKRQPVRGVSHQLVTGKTKQYDTALAAGFGYRDPSRFGLKVTKGLPSTLGIAQLSPKHRHDGPTFASRQRLGKLSCRHRGEKTFDLLAVALHRLSQGLKLSDEHQEQLRLGSDHVLGNLKLRLAELLPQLFTALLTEMVLALGKAVPFSTGKLRQMPAGSDSCVKKIQRDLRFQIRKDLQRPRVILFERYLDLIEKPSLVAPSAGGDPG